MKLSVITPTHERKKFLPLLYNLLKNQTYENWEWLIYDTSFYPMENFSDPRVVYLHTENVPPLGIKRNVLIEKATGDIIVHCDDDDYYSSKYLETVAAVMQKADFFNVNSWFTFDFKTKQFYYWSTKIPGQSHFVLDSMTGMRTREVDFGEYMDAQREKLMKKGRQYGFTFAYKKEVARLFPFGDFDIGEDRHFYSRLEKANFKLSSLSDEKGLVVNVVHFLNTAKVYPQYRIPRFLVEPVFPDFFSYIENYPGNED